MNGLSAALTADGTAWAWGAVPGANSNRPVQVAGLSGISKIFVAGAIYAQKADGTVWEYGNGGARHVPALDGTLQLAGSWDYLVALKPDGTVWTTGQRSSGVLGFATGSSTAGLTQLPRISDAIAITADGSAAMILRRDGTLLSWGNNENGKLGDGTLAQRITPVTVVNETNTGPLDLIPEVPNIPNSGETKPFFTAVTADTSLVGSKPTITNTLKFNGGDIGKPGAVFVTAVVPSGTLGSSARTVSTTTPRATILGSSPRPADATSTPSSSVLMQLTPSGWQPVTNGQLIPYASGVLGDLLAAQTILSGIDTTKLAGAEFCLGYGTSAAEMTTAARMLTVVTIPDSNATGTSAGTCAATPLPVPQGWSLLGNSLNQSLAVTSLYGDSSWVTSVWQWDAGLKHWQFYAPLMDTNTLQSYTSAKGYSVLSEIKPGDGYWVNAKTATTLGIAPGLAYTLSADTLMAGWNLVATGSLVTPSAFNTSLSTTPPATAVPLNLQSLWAWDNGQSKWYFYAPILKAQAGSALTDYIGGKGYLDFTTSNKTLGPGVGFWVNKP
jgi:hypothetical protein